MPSFFFRLSNKDKLKHTQAGVNSRTESSATINIASDGTGAQNEGSVPHNAELVHRSTEQQQSLATASTVVTDVDPQQDPSTSLWTQAYLKIKEAEPSLVAKYEAVLARELPDAGDASLSPAGDATRSHEWWQQMRDMTDRGLKRVDDRTMKYHIAGTEFVVKKQAAQISQIVLKFKDFIADAVKASPAASVAVAGVSMVLPLLLNPTTLDDANKSGLTYVVSRMLFYIGVEEQLWPKRLTLSTDLQRELEADLIALYKAVISFQIKSVLRFYRNWAATAMRDVVKWDDWDALLEEVKAAEAAVTAYFDQLLKMDSRNLLQRLSEQADTNNGLLDGIEGSVNEICRNLGKAVSQHENQHQQQLEMMLTKEQQECHQIFKTSTYEQHKNINPERAEGTCRWILESSQFVDWRTSNHNDLLWVSADPGCGKSVLAKSLIDVDLKSTPPKASICYFFFKDNDEQNSLTTALCAALHQLFSMQPDLLQHALQPWHQNGARLQQEEEELWRILMACSSDAAFKRTICILDALDECQLQHQASLVKKLAAFYNHGRSSTRHNSLKFLITSRPYHDIQKHFHATTRLFPSIHIRGEEMNEQIHNEINLVVKQRVKALSLSPDIKDRLEQQLLSMRHRTYLWLYLTIDAIEEQFGESLQPAEEIITLIPETVSAAYMKILDRVPPRNNAVVRQILSILIGARRPFSIEEMTLALTMIKSNTVKGDKPPKLELDAEKIRRLCGLFVFVQNSRIYLIHQTAREFLLEEREKWSFRQTDLEILMANICIRTLLLNDEGKEANRHSYLLQYTAVHWGDHVREMPADAEQEVAESIDRLYDVASTKFALWYDIFWKEGTSYSWRPVMNNLRMAAFQGHIYAAQRILTEKKDIINDVDTDGMSALFWASDQGHLKMMNLLFDYGAEFGRDRHYQRVLHWASFKGNIEFVRLLLDRGPDVNDPGRVLGRALQTASGAGHVEIARLLLDRGANINTLHDYFGTPLEEATIRGHAEVVRLLLERGADITAQSYGNLGNALNVASDNGSVEIVRLLLDYGADIDAPGGFHGNPLKNAACARRIEVVQLLLDRGAKVDAEAVELMETYCK